MGDEHLRRAVEEGGLGWQQLAQNTEIDFLSCTKLHLCSASYPLYFRHSIKNSMFSFCELLRGRRIVTPQTDIRVHKHIIITYKMHLLLLGCFKLT